MKKGLNRICRICSKPIKPRGMGGHLALAHGIREKEVIKYIVDPGHDPSGVMTESIKYSSQIRSEKIPANVAEKLMEPIIPEILNNVVKEIFDIPVQSEGNLYTETDIRILLARIINYYYQSDQPSQLLRQFAKMDMIEDFEERFKCDFTRVKKENQHIHLGTTEPEHLAFAYKYALLNYSR